MDITRHTADNNRFMSSGDYRNLLARYAWYAPRYDRLFARYSRQTLAKVHEAVAFHRVQSLIDVACGTGIFLSTVRQGHPHVRLAGVDVSEAMLAQARERLGSDSGVMWHVGQAERLPAATASFDVLTCANAFHLVQDAPKALREFRRVIRPGGSLVLVDWCLDHPQMRLLVALQRLLDRQQRQVRRIEAMTEMIEQAGFEIEHAEPFRAGWFWGLMRVVGRAKVVAPPGNHRRQDGPGHERHVPEAAPRSAAGAPTA